MFRPHSANSTHWLTTPPEFRLHRESAVQPG